MSPTTRSSRRASESVGAELEHDRRELQQALDERLADTIRQEWRTNTAAWIAVVAIAFAVNLVLLLVVSGG